MSVLQYAPNEGAETPEVLKDFLEHARGLKSPNVLELGTKQSLAGRSTMHKEWVPNASMYVGTDIEAGDDVDFVADAHKLSSFAGEGKYDVIISCSSFEHFKYPHLAAFEISKTLAVGGCFFVQTHFTFPLHSYPYDYFRFTKEALAGCFGTRNGIKVMGVGYSYPCEISSEVDGKHSSYLNVDCWGLKTECTPVTYMYDLDTCL